VLGEGTSYLANPQLSFRLAGSGSDAGGLIDVVAAYYYGRGLNYDLAFDSVRDPLEKTNYSLFGASI
jgi:hypothetical protein